MAQARSVSQLATLLSLLLISSCVNAAQINIVNSCSYGITACAQASGTGVNCYVLSASGGSQTIDVGATWTGGLIWGFPGSGGSGTGNTAKPQADLAEFTINANGQDYYDISNVNAYNIPIKISVPSIAGGGSSSGLYCGAPQCNVGDLNSFCTSPNKLTGAPGDGCYNVDGPGTVATDGTRKFAAACPDAYSYSKDDANHVYSCKTGSNYEVHFCY